jgi:zinc-finger of transposase IS204/IS1001/IS1096/IS1165
VATNEPSGAYYTQRRPGVVSTGLKFTTVHTNKYMNSARARARRGSGGIGACDGRCENSSSACSVAPVGKLVGVRRVSRLAQQEPIMDVADRLPPDSGLIVRNLILVPDSLQIVAEAAGRSADRPRCGARSDPVHGRCARTVADLPWQGRRVSIRVHVRRSHCDPPGCPRRTFAERVPAVAGHAQTTRRLAEARRAIGLALGGEPGARLAHRLAMPTGPDTLLRRVRVAGSDVRPTPRVLGVDDFAFRKASTYGTILVEMERGRAVDGEPTQNGTGRGNPDTVLLMPVGPRGSRTNWWAISSPA